MKNCAECVHFEVCAVRMTMWEAVKVANPVCEDVTTGIAKHCMDGLAERCRHFSEVKK